MVEVGERVLTGAWLSEDEWQAYDPSTPGRVSHRRRWLLAGLLVATFFGVCIGLLAVGDAFAAGAAGGCGGG